jgi:virginiamycin B lyase
MYTYSKRILIGVSLAAACAVLVFPVSRTHAAGEGWLSGSVTSATGAPLEGAVVSAQVPGETITTSVYTGRDGRYFFPAMKPAKYHLRVQEIGFEESEADVNLGAQTQKADFRMKDTADLIPQLSGYQVMAALPEDTVAHRRGKAILQRTCTYCHEASTALRPRFDQHGWEVMVVTMTNNFSPNPRPLTPLQKELAAYLAEMRGPDKSPMTPKAFHPAGEATLPVIYEYDVRYVDGGYTPHNGADWRYGPASSAGGGGGLHDAVLNPDGNIYFTSTGNGTVRSIGKIDTRTGATIDFALPLGTGTIARSHGMYQSDDGIIWFNGAPQGAGAPVTNGVLGRLDPRAGQITSFQPPGSLKVGGWLGADTKGVIWTAGEHKEEAGALRFDPQTKTFTEFQSPHSKMTYGITADREGKGWWMAVGEDTIEYADRSGKVHEIALPDRPLAEYLKPGDITEKIPQPGVGGVQSPRRPRADHNGTDVWVPNWFGNSLMKIDSGTAEFKYYGVPFPGMSPYEAAVDSKHQVWVSFENGDEVGRFDPKTEKWTVYGWSTRGTAQRCQNIFEHDGVVEVVLASSAAQRVGRMVIRTPEEVEQLRQRAR